MPNPIETTSFDVGGHEDRITFPVPWREDIPTWLRNWGRTNVLVVDDQIQQLADLSDEQVLRKRVCDPLNVGFTFSPECAVGHPLAKDGMWFDAVADRIVQQKERLAALFLDIMFENDWDPLNGSGIKFLSRIHELVPDLPVLVMTQARDERKLHEALARAGLHLAFFQKDSPDRVAVMCRFLCEHGWLSDPTLCAYSMPMRAAVRGLRQYAIRRPRIGTTNVPQPILFTADSGEGKTRSALLAAQWLVRVSPQVRPGDAIETLDCNTLERGQGAQIALFGRGPRDAQEQTHPSGLAVLGKTQLASDGILIIDELGNSEPSFQDMLLSFIESGRTQPEFFGNAMTADALGPLNVLCIFTAQPRHIAEGRIKEDIGRRYSRGATIFIPRLVTRHDDIVPIFYEALRAYHAQDRHWVEPAEIDEVLLPEAQLWLREAAMTHSLSASSLTDLVGQPGIKVIGIPYLKNRLQHILQVRPRRPSVASTDFPVGRSPGGAPVDQTPSELNGLKLIARLADAEHVQFPHDTDQLAGLLDRVQAAAANLLLSYLEASADVARIGQSEVNVAGTYRFVTSKDESNRARPRGTRANATETQVAGNTARTELKNVMLVSKERTLRELRRSDLLAILAIAVAKGNRSKEIHGMLEELSKEPTQEARLAALGWK